MFNHYWAMGLSRYFLLIASLLIFSGTNVHAHGGVAFEDDVCVISIGFLKAHFTGYQPATRGNEEFCEGLPDVGKSVFVLDYFNDFLKKMSVDFRIIKDVENFGIKAKWEDIASLKNIDQVTVFYQSGEKRPDGVFTAEYAFKEAGNYIGIITAQHPTKEKKYTGIFYFNVGENNDKYLLFFLILLISAFVGFFLVRFKSKR